MLSIRIKGNIYHDWASEGVLKVSLTDGVESAFIPNNSKLNNFDISRDGKKNLTVVNEQTVGKYPIRFTLSGSNGNIIEVFVYNSPGLNAYCKSYLSFDNSHILVLSNEKEDGIPILKRNGDFVGRIRDIISLAPPYTSGSLLKEINYQDLSDLAVNPAGNLLAVCIANHVYTMGKDGSNPKQVTNSNFKKAVPEFSPDGKYLLVGTDYKQTGPFGWMWEPKIIPKHSKEYNVDPIKPNTPVVIPVFVNGKDKIETSGG